MHSHQMRCHAVPCGTAMQRTTSGVNEPLALNGHVQGHIVLSKKISINAGTKPINVTTPMIIGYG